MASVWKSYPTDQDNSFSGNVVGIGALILLGVVVVFAAPGCHPVPRSQPKEEHWEGRKKEKPKTLGDHYDREIPIPDKAPQFEIQAKDLLPSNIVRMPLDHVKYKEEEPKPVLLREVKLLQSAYTFYSAVELDGEGRCWLWMDKAIEKEPIGSSYIKCTRVEGGWTVTIPKDWNKKWDLNKVELAKFRYEPVIGLIFEKE